MPFLLLAVFWFSNVWSQEFFSFLSPTPVSTSIELDDFYAPDQDLDKNRDDTHVHSSSIAANQAVYKGEKNLFTVGGRYQKLDLNSKSPVLNDYYNIQAQVGWRRDLDEDKFSFASLSYGSATDKPFKNGRDGTLNANYVQKFNSRWFGIANYSNNRAFLNNIPLPGFFYVKEMTRTKGFIVGFPFLYWMRPLSEKISLRYIGLFPWTHRLKILYMHRPYLMPYLGLEQNPVSYFRHDRNKRFDRFFWFERRLSLGVESVLSKTLRLDLSTGLAFDRQFFEARNFSDSKEFLLNVDNSYFASLSLRYSF